jgi:hypothetical protein
MKIVLSTGSTLGDDTHGCDFALVDIAPVEAQAILRLMDATTQLHRAEASVHQICFWDALPDYLSASADLELTGLLPQDSNSYSVLRDSAELGELDRQWTEYERMVIRVRNGQPEVHWQASPKNCLVDVETAALPRSLIEKVARTEPVEPGIYGHSPVPVNNA